MDLYRDIVQYLKLHQGLSPLLLFKGEDEREALISWLSRVQETAAETCDEPAAFVQKRKADHPSYSFENINQVVDACYRCPDPVERKHPVGSGTNGVMVILNAPPFLTTFEKERLRPESVALLKKVIASLGISLGETYITNLIKCESKDPLFKPSAAFANCSPFLEMEITGIAPYIIIVMGDLMPLRKIRKKHPEVNWFEIPHPVTMIKNPDLKRDAWRTLKNMIAVYKEYQERT